MKIKEELIKLGVKLGEESSIDQVNDFLYLVDELRTRIDTVNTRIIGENVREMKNIFSELNALAELQRLLYVPELGLGIDLERIPPEIRTEITTDIEEIKKCYSSGAYRAAIVFCGRILEIALARKYFEKVHIDPIKQKWTLGQLIRECKRKIRIFQPGLDSLCEAVNKIKQESLLYTKVRKGYTCLALKISLESSIWFKACFKNCGSLKLLQKLLDYPPILDIQPIELVQQPVDLPQLFDLFILKFSPYKQPPRKC